MGRQCSALVQCFHYQVNVLVLYIYKLSWLYFLETYKERKEVLIILLGICHFVKLTVSEIWMIFFSDY